jgi:iron(III) transport system substrate-binding protein
MAGGAGIKVSNPALEALGKFKADTLPVGSLAMYRAKAQVIFDRAAYR